VALGLWRVWLCLANLDINLQINRGRVQIRYSAGISLRDTPFSHPDLPALDRLQDREKAVWWISSSPTALYDK
jgi:hypothetical protein